MKTNAAFPDITKLVPHRKPMLLLDRVVASSAGSITCEADNTKANLFLERDGIPAVLCLEYMAQASAALLGLWAYQSGGPLRGGLLLGTPSLRLTVSCVAVPSTLLVYATHVWGEGDAARFDCRVEHERRTIAVASLNVMRFDFTEVA